jgi:hypothetical protein
MLSMRRHSPLEAVVLVRLPFTLVSSPRLSDLSLILSLSVFCISHSLGSRNIAHTVKDSNDSFLHKFNRLTTLTS